VRHRFERGPVEHQVAADLAHAGAADALNQQPEILDDEPGIATAAQPQVAFEHA
jgi:hypothetical protein